MNDHEIKGECKPGRIIVSREDGQYWEDPPALSIASPAQGNAGQWQQATRPYHTDDAAVDRFAQAMKDKLALCRAKGRSGWQDPLLCTGAELRRLMRGAIIKGDPVDVGNLVMMLHQRQEKTSGEYLQATPPEGILHHALEELAAHEAQRIARESKGIVTAGVDVANDRIEIVVVDWHPLPLPRSGDMHQVASVMQPQQKEFIG